VSDKSNSSGSSQENVNKPPVKTAVALGYDPGKDNAPRVLASGKGHIAEQILAIAKQHQLPIRDDPILAEALSQVDLNQVIPAELYAVVAEVFAFVYRLKQKKVDS
jgi:flagellar biosynthesis protein